MRKKKLKKITRANITHVSFVPNGANGQDFLIVKADGAEPNLQVESPILKVDEEKHLVTGVVYAPGVVDSQGEFMEAEAIEEAAHEFLAKHGGTDVRHNFVTNKDVAIVESYVAKADYVLGDVPITKGTWIITAKVQDNQLWEGIKKGVYNGFSMGGTGIREEVIVEDGEIKKKAESGFISEEEKGLFALLKGCFTGSEKVERAGKCISGANAAKIKVAHEALGALLSLTEENEEEDEVKIEELKAIVKEAVAPLAAKVEALEKGETAPEITERMTKEDLAAIITEALAPLEERVTSVEKTRGLSRQMEGETQILMKEGRTFSGVQI